MSDARLVKLVTQEQFERVSTGGMFMDLLPPHLAYSEIQQLAENRKTWKQMDTHIENLPTTMTRCIEKV